MDPVITEIEGPARELQTPSLNRLWWGVTASTVASRTLVITYPLLALATTHSPTAVGLTTAMLTVPGLLFYLPVGVLADRVAPHFLIRQGESFRAAIIITVMIMVALGVAQLPLILVAAFLEGTLSTVYSVAEAALVPLVAHDDKVDAALAASERSTQLGALVARPLAGALFGLNQVLPFIIGPILVLLSSRSVPRYEEKCAVAPEYRAWPTGRFRLKELRAAIVEGFQELRSHSFLRAAVILTAATNFMVNALIVAFIASSIEVGPLIVGLVLAAGSIGGTLGTILAERTQSQKWILSIHLVIWTFALMLPAVNQHPVFFAFALLLTGWGAATNVAMRRYEKDKVAADKLARVVSVSRLAGHAAVVAAALVGGLLVDTWNIQVATRILSITMVTICVPFGVWLLFLSKNRVRTPA
ncbi:MFS transporter [Acrocarpospora corrugata]|nr:MFS transporter [Acrocarpospora corrugata]